MSEIKGFAQAPDNEKVRVGRLKAQWNRQKKILKMKVDPTILMKTKGRVTQCPS